VTFLTRPPGIVVVRKRAFLDDLVSREVVETARRLQARARERDVNA
jgi:hypothetical protein